MMMMMVNASVSQRSEYVCSYSYMYVVAASRVAPHRSLYGTVDLKECTS